MPSENSNRPDHAASGKFKGTKHDDVIAGTEDGELLQGLEGNDILDGLGGDDTLIGGLGNDLLIGGDGADVLDGGEGDDRLALDAGDDVLTGGAGADGFEVALGDIGNDTITDFDPAVDSFRLASLATSFNISETAGGALLTLSGDISGTILFEGLNAAQVTEALPQNLIEGTSSGETLIGDGFRNWISGLGGDDFLHGEAGEDRLDGGEGADTLDGGPGDDVVSGGAGSDTFAFRGSAFNGYGNDVIEDFVPGEDVIRFHADNNGEVSPAFDPLALAVQDGNDVVIPYAVDASVRLLDTQLADLSAADFEVLPELTPGGVLILAGTYGDDTIMGTSSEGGRLRDRRLRRQRHARRC